jgi:lipopolysaccharide export system protein LptA
MIDIRVYIITLILCLFAGYNAHAQQGQDAKKEVKILYSNTYQDEERPDGLHKWLGGEVRLWHDSVFLFCDTAFIFEKLVRATGETSLVQGDSLEVFADTLIYNGETGLARLIGNVLLINGDKRLQTDSMLYDVRARQATFNSGGWLTTDSSRIYCVNGLYDVRDRTVLFRDSVQVQQPNFRLRADSMAYDIDTDRVIFLGPTRMKQQQADLYCEDGYYYLSEGHGLFKKNAQFRDSTRSAQADEIYYYAKTNDFKLIGQAEFIDGDRLATGDTLSYREKTGEFSIRGNGFVKDANQTITAEGIDFNTRTERFQTIGRSQIQDGSQLLEADNISNRDSTDRVLVQGNVTWRDTVANVLLNADSAIYQRSTGYFEAFGFPPVLMQIIDGDTLFLIADIIISLREEGPDSARLILAHHNVFIYKSDLQIVCDSTVYLASDSTFYFYQDPVVWSDTSQFTADTIRIQMANQQMDSIFLLRNSMIINTADYTYFNQIKGRNITVVFEENSPEKMHVNGNAQTIYYALDEDNAYLGVNQSDCSDMLMLFEQKQLQDIYYLRSPSSTMYPMNQVDHNSLKLEGYRWREDERPLSLDDIIERWRSTLEIGASDMPVIDTE